MSVLRPKADIVHAGENVRFVPKADIETDQPNLGCNAVEALAAQALCRVAT